MGRNKKVLVGDTIQMLTPTDIKNCIAYRFYQNSLRGIATVRTEWNDLPDNIDEMFVNEKLLSTDMCYFKDEVLDKEYILPVSAAGSLDIQGIPQKWEVHGQNGYIRECTPEDSVLIRCTPCTVEGELMTPWACIDFFAEKLAEIDRTIAINLKRQKTPWILAGDQVQLKTMEKFFIDIDNNVPFIPVDKDWENMVKVLNTVAPLVVPELYEYKKSVWQEALTHLGITNSSIEKKERVNTQEVEANNAGTVMMRYLVLAPYQQAIKRINKMFNRNISITFRDNVGASLDGTSEIEDEEGEQDDNA